MPSKIEDSLQLDVLRPHQDELLHLAELAGIQMDPKVFSYMVQLLNMRASPEVVFHLLKYVRRHGSSSRRKTSRTSTSRAYKEQRDQSVQTKVALDEDFEFRDLVMQTLEKNGALAKIKASLRASICLALDEDTKLSQLEPLKNIKLQSYIKTPEGRAMFSIVHEFLEYFELHDTLMVYDSETSLGSSYKYGGKRKTQNDLGIDNTEELNVPILEQILQIAQSKSKILDIKLNVSNVNITKESIIEENSYNGTFCESIDSKLSSFNEEDSKRVFKLNNATFDFNDVKNSTFVKPRNSLESGSDESLNSPMYKLHDKTNSTFLKNRTGLEPLQETIREDENTINNEKLSIIEENLSLLSEDQNILMSPLELEDTKLNFDEISKNKVNVSSLTDLPPLPINKNRLINTLQPMNSKDVQEKSNLRELDKMFDLANDYEEDFDLSISKEYSLSIQKETKRNLDKRDESSGNLEKN